MTAPGVRNEAPEYGMTAAPPEKAPLSQKGGWGDL